MTKEQYSLYRKIYLEMKQNSDEIIDGPYPLLRLKNIYLRNFTPKETEFSNCNIYEVAELKKRAVILKWIEDDMIRQLIKETTQ